MPAVLDWVGIGFSLVLGIVYLVFDGLLIALRSCPFSINEDEQSWLRIFLREHIEDAGSNAGNCHGVPYWVICNGTGVQNSTTPIYSFVDADSVLVFICVHLTIVVVWLLTTFGVWFGAQRRWNFFWLCSTAMVLLYGAVVAGLFSVELSEAKLCFGRQTEEQDLDFKSNNLIAKLILPIYFSYGIIFWMLGMVLWCLMCMKTCRSMSKEKSEKKTGRSLSEVHSEEYSNKLNKRFDQAQTIEEEESTKGSTDSLVKRSHVVQRSHASSDWVYANPGMVLEFDNLTASKSNSGTLQYDIYASPTSFKQGNDVEDDGGRRFGRPSSMPPIDYKLPRASLSPKTSYKQDEITPVKRPRKAIRTPSGRSVSAMEYLRSGYQPSSPPLSEEREENDGVHRYFVKLKE